MRRLYIIGNGFDMHHTLKTSYINYAHYIKLKFSDIYDKLIENFPLNDIEFGTKWDPLWARFEESLGELYVEDFLDNYTEYAANPAADDFRDGDWDTISVYIEQDIDEILKGLNETFTKFISNVSFPSDISSKRLKIDHKARFINFNYTDTLERYYQVNRKNILYIHNKSGEINPLILGHAVEKPDSFPSPEMPKNLTNEEKQDWIDFQSENYNLSVERGKWEIENYFAKSLKKTSEILANNNLYFSSLTDIEEIFVLGHSISDVDLPYFRSIFQNINSTDILWNISYYNENSIDDLQRNLTSIGVNSKNIRFVKLDELSYN